ncbi:MULTISPECIES: type II toxin-antitoxin system RelE/ParE family toxin [Photorhabdus]|uniref:Killer protein n=1 Tax=Photorhabdus hindustanensis TaxID=2918802 RepID=A0A0A0CN46_9GAMM|nr:MULTISPECIES: type II toxin-antitoxin system RelE/ParE family toxin [Photorhabdus]KGM26282.1 Killer protein [Photorhabdus luminescens]KTL61265.1 Killer protein [Photorhabdus laumondii subsp. laumondii]MBS9430407.1 Killer protein [Photorhabdus akhurstii]MCT8350896.1 type II toxin-antitoxin system RelE/ParE family toxin [Photorhabdus kayaii]NHB61904.1 Killer protein [Photorhabdus sp. RW14-46]
MIKSFKHKGLRQFFEKGVSIGINPQHANKLRQRLAVINEAEDIGEINLPGYNLHPLTGNRQGQWAITISGNWRVTFEFIDGDAYIVNYEDYH